MHGLIHAHPLGWLISAGEGGLSASLIPFLLDPDANPNGTLRAHMARNNAQWRELAGGAECMVLFQGEQGYVTPDWYVSKHLTEQVVPTWNYIAVQAWGRPTVHEDPAWLQKAIEDLTVEHEQGRVKPWTVGDAPAEFIAKQKEGIVGIEIPIVRIEGKWKLSQNRNPADRAGVVTGLGDEADPHHNPVLRDLVEERIREEGKE
jgi:transcriptional regulator